MDFITEFDFHQTYTDKIEKQMIHNFEVVDNESTQFLKKSKSLMTKLSEMSMLLMKMAIQCIDFAQYSASTIVISSIYASTAFLKNSKYFEGQETNKFIIEVRKIIF